MQLLVRSIAAGIALIGILASSASFSIGASSLAHPSGIEILPPIHFVEPMPEQLATALADAQEFARQHPEEFGYPYADRATNEIVLSLAAGPAAERLALRWSPRAEAASIQRRGRHVSRTLSQLLAIRSEIAGRGTPLADHESVQGVTSDDEGNRVVVIVNRLSDKLLYELVARYGTAAVAVRLDPAFGPFRNLGRNDDTAPFWGGARINNLNQPIEGQCTSGFAWQWNGAAKMITAGHCAHAGGNIYTPGINGQFTNLMGYVDPGTRENWRPGWGSDYVPGQLNYVEGDMAMIPVSASSAVMYRGQVSPVVYASVREMWWRRAQAGDQYCTGGASTFELCGWGVTYSDIDTNHGGGAWALHMVVGTKLGTCATGGDSGGPTYTVRPDGGIAAKGILSGAFGAGTSGNPCTVDFTNIHQALSLWPGSSLKVQ